MTPSAWRHYRLPSLPKAKNLIKRVIGLPGDMVEIRNGVVSVNGVIVDEPHSGRAPTYSSSWVVPEGQYRSGRQPQQLQRLTWGFLPTDHILGRRC
jgi:signal peptidase I